MTSSRRRHRSAVMTMSSHDSSTLRDALADLLSNLKGEILLLCGIITGLTESLLCGTVVTVSVESCYWCDSFALKILLALIFLNYVSFLCKTYMPRHELALSTARRRQLKIVKQKN